MAADENAELTLSTPSGQRHDLKADTQLADCRVAAISSCKGMLQQALVQWPMTLAVSMTQDGLLAIWSLPQRPSTRVSMGVCRK
jgi:hypothetical protein